MDTTLLKGMKLALTVDKLTLFTPLVQRAKDIHRQHDCEEALQVDFVKTGYVTIRAGEGEGNRGTMVTIQGCIS